MSQRNGYGAAMFVIGLIAGVTIVYACVALWL